MPTMAATRIPRGPIDLSAHLHLPDDVDDRAALVIATPGSSVKEAAGPHPVIEDGGADAVFAARAGGQTVGAHQALHGAASHRDSLPVERQPDLRAP